VKDNRPFSSQLESWLNSKHPKTVADLAEVFHDKSFAVGLLILMFIPALPLPTGGVTHIFEIVAMLLSLEVFLGKRTVWLPRRWRTKNITGIGERKSVTVLIKQLRWVEKYSKPRLKQLVGNSLFMRATGLALFIFCLAAFLAPPFSGLDTLPSLAVVFIALSVILEDFILYVLGLLVGAVGIGAILVLGTALFRSFRLL